MAPHTRKRHIPSTNNKITSYFSASPSTHTYPTTLSYTNTAAYAPPTLAPTLPAEVQSNLLNVGMRVRKAMGERAAVGMEKKMVDAPVRSVGNVVGSGSGRTQAQVQGLMPMCGMHKVGGWGVQSAVSTVDMDEEDAWPLSSQESVESCMTSASANSIVTPARGKRSFSEEEDEDEEDTTVPLATPGMERRQIANARGRGRRGVLRREGSSFAVPSDAEMDFGEAEWLGPRSPGAEGEEGMEF